MFSKPNFMAIYGMGLEGKGDGKDLFIHTLAATAYFVPAINVPVVKELINEINYIKTLLISYSCCK